VAIKHNQPAIGAFLLDRGADVNNDYSIDEGGLAGAAINPEDPEDLRFLRMMLESGATTNNTGALQEASREGRLPAVKLLVEHGADLEELPMYLGLHERLDFGTALWMAAANIQAKVVKYLLSKGADPHYRERQGLAVFEVAQDRDFPETAAVVQQFSTT
jgi:ankyrin repeat protein